MSFRVVPVQDHELAPGPGPNRRLLAGNGSRSELAPRVGIRVVRRAIVGDVAAAPAAPADQLPARPGDDPLPSRRIRQAPPLVLPRVISENLAAPDEHLLAGPDRA